MVESRGLAARPIGTITSGVFGFFGLEVQEEFMVGKLGGLGVDDLGWVLGVDEVEVRNMIVVMVYIQIELDD